MLQAGEQSCLQGKATLRCRYFSSSFLLKQQAACPLLGGLHHLAQVIHDERLVCTGRRSSTITAIRQFKDRDSAKGTAQRAQNAADEQSSELLDKANAYVDDLKVDLTLILHYFGMTTALQQLL